MSLVWLFDIMLYNVGTLVTNIHLYVLEVTTSQAYDQSYLLKVATSQAYDQSYLLKVATSQAYDQSYLLKVVIAVSSHCLSCGGGSSSVNMDDILRTNGLQVMAMYVSLQLLCYV